MEAHQQQQAGGAGNEDGGGSGGGKGGYMCRQSSTRWTPTSDQIRILKELYYNNGVRSPNAEQIQKISARLRQYGKIEGKNVFYWFQNHKARERQKKRFTSDHLPNPLQTPSSSTTNAIPPPWKPDHHLHHPNYSHTSPSSAGVSSASSSSAGMFTLGQMGNYGYGSVTMEKCFRDCSISAGGSSGWVGVDPYASNYTNFLDKIRASDQFESLKEEQEEGEDGAAEIETLPLFPMHGEDIHGHAYCNLKSDTSYYGASGYRTQAHAFNNNNNASHRTSLELTLNSYTPTSPDSTS